MGSKYTDAQRRATDNYNKTLKNIGIRVKPEIYNRIKNGSRVWGFTQFFTFFL